MKQNKYITQKIYETATVKESLKQKKLHNLEPILQKVKTKKSNVFGTQYETVSKPSERKAGVESMMNIYSIDNNQTIGMVGQSLGTEGDLESRGKPMTPP